MDDPTLKTRLESDLEDTIPEGIFLTSDKEGGASPNALPTRVAPAMTIHIQSWATPLVGLVMLAFGLFAGYYARPIFDPPATSVTELPSSESSSSAAEQSAPQDQAARQQQLMELLLSRTRHFTGNENAPVTLVEFSDFQ